MAGQGLADGLAAASAVGDDAGRALAKLRGHVVICNCSDKLRRVVEDLQRASAPAALDVVLLVQDEQLWRAHPDWHPTPSSSGQFFTIFGCPTEAECLRRARIAEARAAVILADPNQGALADARSTLVAVAIERHNPQVHTVMELLSSVNRDHLRTTEVNEVICLGDVTEKLLAQSCLTPGVKNLFSSLLSVEPGSPSIFTSELPAALAGQSYRALAQRAIAQGAPFVLIGFACRGNGAADAAAQRRLVLNPRSGDEPGRDSTLAAGDQLVIMASAPPELERYLAAPTAAS